MTFAVTVPVVATPEPLVTAVAPATVALAPETGGAKVTVTPETGLLPASRTVAVSTAAKAVPTTADWGEPLVTTIEAAGPAVFVIAKLTEVRLVAEATML